MTNYSIYFLLTLIIVVLGASEIRDSEATPKDILESRPLAEVEFAKKTSDLIRQGIESHDPEILLLAAERMEKIAQKFAVKGLFEGEPPSMVMGNLPNKQETSKRSMIAAFQAKDLYDAARSSAEEKPMIGMEVMPTVLMVEQNEEIGQQCLYGYCCGRYGCWRWCSWW